MPDYDQAETPPDTPPVIDPDVDPKKAADMALEGDREGPVLEDGTFRPKTSAGPPTPRN